MADKKKPTTNPFSLRLTFEERANLEKAAGRMPLGEFIRSQVLKEERSYKRTRGDRPVKDYTALAKVLGELGRSRMANNLNQLAHAVHTGSLPVTPETEAFIQAACKDVKRLRADLVRALGLQSGGPTP